MSDVLRITDAQPVLQGVLKLTWNDGYEGIVDLRGILAEGEIFERIQCSEDFRRVRVDEFGHSVYWGEDADHAVDFGCDRLRELAEQQAALLARAS